LEVSHSLESYPSCTAHVISVGLRSELYSGSPNTEHPLTFSWFINNTRFWAQIGKLNKSGQIQVLLAYYDVSTPEVILPVKVSEVALFP